MGLQLLHYCYPKFLLVEPITASEVSIVFHHAPLPASGVTADARLDSAGCGSCERGVQQGHARRMSCASAHAELSRVPIGRSTTRTCSNQHLEHSWSIKDGWHQTQAHEASHSSMTWLGAELGCADTRRAERLFSRGSLRFRNAMYYMIYDTWHIGPVQRVATTGLCIFAHRPLQFWSLYTPGILLNTLSELSIRTRLKLH